MEKSNNIIESIQEFIQIPSYSRNEKRAAQYLMDLMEKLNYDEVNYDEWGNVIGFIEGKSEETVLFDGHIDTVKVDNQKDWENNPFEAVIKKDRIYGRGTSDMKAALIIMVYAASTFIKNSSLEKNIVVTGTVQEELYEGVSQAKVIEEIEPDLVVIGEASNLNLCIGQRGRAELKLKTLGKNAHSSNPKLGVNAVTKMTKLLNKIDILEIVEDEDLGEGILEVVDIKSKPYPGHSVVPHECTVTIDRRLLPEENKKSVLKPINDLITEIKRKDNQFIAEVEIAVAEDVTHQGKIFKTEKFFPGWKYNVKDNYIQNILKGLNNNGLNTEIDYYSFCTNGSQSAGKKNIPTIGYGPSQEGLAHMVDEYIEINQIDKAYQGYISIIETFLKG